MLVASPSLIHNNFDWYILRYNEQETDMSIKFGEHAFHFEQNSFIIIMIRRIRVFKLNWMDFLFWLNLIWVITEKKRKSFWLKYLVKVAELNGKLVKIRLPASSVCVCAAYNPSQISCEHFNSVQSIGCYLLLSLPIDSPQSAINLVRIWFRQLFYKLQCWKSKRNNRNAMNQQIRNRIHVLYVCDVLVAGSR